MVFGMGSNSIEIEVESSGVSELNAKLRSGESALSSFGNKAKSAGKIMAGLGAAGVVGVTAALGKSVQAAASFEDAMVQVEKVTDPQTMRKMSDEIRNMATTIPLAQTELAQITEDAARFGIRGSENLTTFTRTVAKMVNATDLGANQAGEAFAKLAQLTGMPISKVGNLGSAINSLSNTAATSSAEIVDAMMRASGTLASVGMNERQIAALSATMNEVSESAERAGTRLRRLGQEVFSATGQDAVQFGRILAGNMNLPMEKAMAKFRGMKKNAPTKMLKILAQRMKQGGREASVLNEGLSTTSRQALSGLGQNLKGLDANLKMANKSFREGTSLQREFQAQSKTFNNQIQLLKNTLTNVAITIGNLLLPHITALTKRVNSGIRSFMKWNKEMNGMPVKVAAIGTAVTSLGLIVAGLTTYLYGVVGGFAGAKAAMVGFQTSAVATGGAVKSFMLRIFALSRAIVTLPARIAASTMALWSNRAAVLANAKAYAVNAAKSVGLFAKRLLLLPFRLAATTAAMVASTASSFTLAGAFGTLTAASWASVTALGSVAATLGAVMLPIAALGVAVAGLYLAWKSNFFGIRDLTRGVTKAVKALIRGDIGAAKRFMVEGTRTMRNAFNRHFGPIATKARVVMNQLRSTIRSALTFIDKTLFQPTVRRITRLWNTFGDDLVREIRMTWNSINSGVVRPATNVSLDLFRKLKKVGTFLFNTFGDEALSAIKVAFDLISTTVTVAIDGIITTIRVLLAFLRGDWQGGLRIAGKFFERTFNRAKGFIKRWKTAVVGIFQGFVDGVINVFRRMYNVIVGNSIVPEMLSAINRRVNQFASNTAGRFRNFVNTVIGSFRNLMNTSRSKVASGMSAIHGRFAQALSNIRNRVSGWKGAVTGLVRNALSGMTRAAAGWVSNFTRPFRKAKQRVIGEFNELKRKVVGNSIVPDMLRDTIDESDSWVHDFKKPFRNAKEDAINEFTELKNRLNGRVNKIKGTIDDLINKRKKARKKSRGSSKGRSVFEDVWKDQFAVVGSTGVGGFYDKLKRNISRGASGFSGSIRNGTPNNAGASFAALNRSGMLGRSKSNVMSSFLSYWNDRDKHRRRYKRDYGYDMTGKEAAISAFINRWGKSPFEMASGALVTGPTNALIGEGRNDEFVTPAPMMESILGRMASSAVRRAYAGADGGAGGSGVVINGRIVIYANSYEEGREAGRGFRHELESSLTSP